MKSSAELKFEARQQLKGRWSGPVVASLVFFIVTFAVAIVLSFIPFIGIFSIVLTAPLSLGIITFYIKFTNYENVDVPQIFSGFNRWTDSVVLTFLVGLFTFLWILPFFIVYIICLFLFINNSNPYNIIYVSNIRNISNIILGLVAFIALIISAVISTIKALSYSMALYVLAENPTMKPLDAIKWSKKLTCGHKGRIFYIQLSFIGWSILCIFTLGIGYLWLYPYMSVTMVNLYNELKDLNPEYYGNTVEENNNNNPYYNTEYYNQDNNNNNN